MSAAKQIAHRPGLATAFGLRAGSNGLSMISQTGLAEPTTLLLLGIGSVALTGWTRQVRITRVQRWLDRPKNGMRQASDS